LSEHFFGGLASDPDIHLGDVHLQAQLGQAVHVLEDVVWLGRPIYGDVHLEAHAVDGHTALQKAAHQGIDRVRLFIERLAAVIAVEEQRIGIGLVLNSCASASA
jgi:hypothetical protein